MHARKVRIMFVIALAIIVVGSASVARAAADPSQPVDLLGTVVAYSAASGSGMPMLTIEDGSLGTVDVALGPVWFLQAAGFSAAVGDQVAALAYPCDVCAAPYVAAWVDNISSGVSIELRDDSATPLWIGQGSGGSGSGGNGGGNGGGIGGGSGGGSGETGGSGDGNPGGSGQGVAGGLGGLDLTQVQTVTGVVDDFAGMTGAGQATMYLNADGTVLEIIVSPYRPVQAAGLVIQAGLTLTVTYAPAECDGQTQLVTISLTDDATGLTIQLRDPETGFPITLGGNHRRPNWD